MSRSSSTSRTYRTVAAVSACALIASAYIAGDVLDAFPGVLTIRHGASEPVRGVPASGESLRTQLPQRLGESAPLVVVTSEQIAASLEQAAGADVLSSGYAYSVVDAVSGEVLAEHEAQTARIPASTMKLMTALAASRTLELDNGVSTRAFLADNTLYLVGGGDMFLAGPNSPKPRGFTRASLVDLADQSAVTLAAQGIERGSRITLILDDSIFAHDPINPAWEDNGPDGGWVAPITSIGVDGGRLDAREFGAVSKDPSKDALETFADLLRERGYEVDLSSARSQAPEDALVAGEVTSAPMREWIRYTLLYSDNTMAELIGRHVARASQQPTTVKGAVKAVHTQITAFAEAEGIDLDGMRIVDNSGLSRDNRLSPHTLASLAARAAGGEDPQAREVFSLTPIAGLNGTLSTRFDHPDVVHARGVVRGKTGYLGGVASLAGTTVLADGRVVGFSIVAEGFEPSEAPQARAAVDDLARAIMSAGTSQPATDEETEPSDTERTNADARAARPPASEQIS